MGMTARTEAKAWRCVKSGCDGLSILPAWGPDLCEKHWDAWTNRGLLLRPHEISRGRTAADL